MDLIESSPSTSAESWREDEREESQPDEREELADDKETGARCETDMTGQAA